MNISLGPMHAASFVSDAKHLGFMLARYKFVARMLFGYRDVLEIGAGDGTGAQVVQQAVGHLVCIDREPLSDAVLKWDILRGPPPLVRNFDGVYAIDVLEHIWAVDEDAFFRGSIACMVADSTMIIGTPSLESQKYASEQSRMHHVNCKTEDGLRATMLRYFHRVYLFGMNDETLHTGFGLMCHYRLAIGVMPRRHE